jgi:hypothetical protein
MKTTIYDIPLPEDKDKINVGEAKALRDWADRLGTTTARLKSAVNMVGDSAKKSGGLFKQK